MTPVKVRDYPASFLPNGETKVLGQIPQGGKIFNVIIVDGIQPLSKEPGRWGAPMCSDTTEVTWTNGQKPSPDSVCTVYADYLVADK